MQVITASEHFASYLSTNKIPSKITAVAIWGVYIISRTVSNTNASLPPAKRSSIYRQNTANKIPPAGTNNGFSRPGQHRQRGVEDRWLTFPSYRNSTSIPPLATTATTTRINLAAPNVGGIIGAWPIRRHPFVKIRRLWALYYSAAEAVSLCSTKGLQSTQGKKVHAQVAGAYCKGVTEPKALYYNSSTEGEELNLLYSEKLTRIQERRGAYYRLLEALEEFQSLLLLIQF